LAAAGALLGLADSDLAATDLVVALLAVVLPTAETAAVFALPAFFSVAALFALGAVTAFLGLAVSATGTDLLRLLAAVLSSDTMPLLVKKSGY
jgi:hypothetical protein